MAGGALDRLIWRARRRWVRNLMVAQVVRAGCVAAGGLIALLLAGAQVLDWPWLAALLAASLLGGFLHASRRMPSPYQVAQAVDRNLGLEDALSTAFFYHRLGSGRPASAAMRAAQLAAAEELCRAVDLRRAVPWRVPRATYLAATLIAVAVGLFALRYGMARRLELSRALPKIVLDTLRPPVRPQAAQGKSADPRLQDYWQSLGVTLDEQATAEERAAARGRYSPEGARPVGMSASSEAEEGGEAPGDRLALGTEQQPAQQPGAAQRNENRPAGSDSLLEKFRDAFANLLNRLKIQPRGGEARQVASSALAASEAAQGRQAPSPRGLPGSGREVSEGDSASEAHEMQASEGGQKSSNAPGRRGKEGETEASREGRSGIGREEGSKQLREAEQLAAMGKISELIGRRSQSLTGEVMVEVTSGRQQLRTAYTAQQAAHAEAGGVVQRDEIPLVYQGYVERYFEEVRKLAPEAAGRRK